MLLTDPVSGAVLRCGKVVCIGRNYAKHAAEMDAEIPAAPVVFLKPTTALLPSGGHVVLPEMSREVHHELELVALIGRAGKDIKPNRSLDHVAGYAIGLDMTARDLQANAKARGQPWSVAKGFDTFAPVGEFVPSSEIHDVQSLKIELTVNGKLRQSGYTRDMIFSVAHLLAFCSRVFTLERGDLLYTGTPDGVGPVHSGDVLVATCADLPTLTVEIV